MTPCTLLQTMPSAQSGNCHFLAHIPSWWWGWGMHGHPLSLYSVSTIMYKAVVYDPTERAGTLPLFLLYPDMHSVSSTNFATTISTKIGHFQTGCSASPPPPTLCIICEKGGGGNPLQRTERCTFLNWGDIGFVAAYGRRPVIRLGLREGTVLSDLPPLTNL